MDYIESAIAEAVAASAETKVEEAKSEPVEAKEEAPKTEETTTEETVEESTEPDEVEQLKIQNKKIINANSRKEKVITNLGKKLTQANQTIAELQQKLAAPAPREEDFEGKPYGEFLTATTRHEIKVGNAEEAIQNLTKEASEIQAELGGAVEKAIDESGEIAAKTYPDFMQTIEKYAAQFPSGKIEFSRAAWDVMSRSDDGMPVIYAIVKDNAFSHFNSLPPIEAAMMFKDYERKAESLPKIKHVSSAPEPITSARGVASGSKSKQDYSHAEALNFFKS